jgi:monothiol glutaredoxin
MTSTDANPSANNASPGADHEHNGLREQIGKAIDENEVILFMKGTPEAPACGFSARTVASLQALGTPFAAVDVLVDPRIRQELSALSNWPTIPQLFVNGELVGGSDIVVEMYESGELAELLGRESESESETASSRPTGPAAEPTQQFTPVENRLG